MRHAPGTWGPVHTWSSHWNIYTAVYMNIWQSAAAVSTVQHSTGQPTAWGGGYCFCLATHSGFADSAPGHSDSKFLLVAHSARYWSAHHTWQTRFFKMPSVKHWHTGAFFLGRTSTYLLKVILVGVRGDRTRNPWIGSRVFYHWAKTPLCNRMWLFIPPLPLWHEVQGWIILACVDYFVCHINTSHKLHVES